MIVFYSAQSLADLASIAEYLAARNPVASARVAFSIRKTIDGLAVHPEMGRRQDVDGVRKVVEPVYRYLIYYHLDQIAKAVTVLSIRHPARDRLFGDA